jgi:hypothetical protein
VLDSTVSSRHVFYFFSPNLADKPAIFFYQNYGQTCLSSTSCQQQIVDVDSASSVHIYSLSTVGTTFQISVNGAGVVPASSNLNGFAETVTLWSSS